MFLLKKNIRYFFHKYCAIKFVYVVVPLIVIETFFRHILRIIFDIEFQCESMVFQNQRAQTEKY